MIIYNNLNHQLPKNVGPLILKDFNLGNTAPLITKAMLPRMDKQVSAGCEPYIILQTANQPSGQCWVPYIILLVIGGL